MTETSIRAAPDELVALARVMRPQWDHDVLAAALVAARTAGWTWTRTLTAATRLLVDESASPWDLKRAAANPLRREAGTPATGTFRRARAELDARGGAP
jgi:hypothetical protein